MCIIEEHLQHFYTRREIKVEEINQSQQITQISKGPDLVSQSTQGLGIN